MRLFGLPPKEVDPASFVLVTGASRNHGKSLVQLLESISRYEPGLNVIVYDLGLRWGQRSKVRRAFPAELRTFRYRRYPPHVNINVARGQYAWKPIIINEVAAASGGTVCWMDAGNVLTSGLSDLRAHVREHGFYSTRSSGTVADWTHPGMLTWLGISDDWQGLARGNLSAACVAFDTGNAAAMAVIAEWGRLALIEECIAPAGSDRLNHRQDQALLTVLAYRAGFAAPAEKALGFRIRADID
jgi:hypothetical protein